ncbi:zinc-dependent metalloprotease [Psychromicrobium sp. YIM B11713]|uniref:zinc-dependent metalloprotease n=1 Tax=Psychromicrobium sp. YIM B11713 TaxID=3145233 RepID=UPI00374EC420
MSTLINWDLAASTAAKLAPAGPKLSGLEVSAAVADLRKMADRSVPYVHQITGLEVAADLRDSQVLIVDRASWAKANTQGFSVMLASTLVRVEQRAREQNALKPAARAISGTVTGAQLGAVLAFLSSKVLGQYDPFAALASESSVPSAGRLLLVAPNIISVERELGVDPADFRLWVCLHEQTHRVQFAAAPWLRDHMLSEVNKLSSLLLGNMDSLGERVSSALKGLPGSGTAADSSRGGVLDLLQDPQEKAALSHLTAVMSLLEGHANVVMDAVDASIVPTVKTIRQRFNSRGKDRGAVEKFIRNLLGLNAKMRQYTDGARFVRAVVDQVGMPGFNRVWESAEQLPTEEEIHQPALWVRRMGLAG